MSPKTNPKVATSASESLAVDALELVSKHINRNAQSDGGGARGERGESDDYPDQFTFLVDQSASGASRCTQKVCLKQGDRIHGKLSSPKGHNAFANAVGQSVQIGNGPNCLTQRREAGRPRKRRLKEVGNVGNRVGGPCF
jgi:hypothetical protein